jgi:hypothetical protein
LNLLFFYWKFTLFTLQTTLYILFTLQTTLYILFTFQTTLYILFTFQTTLYILLRVQIFTSISIRVYPLFKCHTRFHSRVTSGITKPGKVGEILALFQLKLPSFYFKAKLKSPYFFLQVAPILQIMCFLVKLIDI